LSICDRARCRSGRLVYSKGLTTITAGHTGRNTTARCGSLASRSAECAARPLPGGLPEVALRHRLLGTCTSLV